MKKKNINEEILTEQELANYWKVSRRFVQEARYKYGLKFYKLGKCVRLKKSEADLWMEERKAS